MQVTRQTIVFMKKTERRTRGTRGSNQTHDQRRTSANERRKEDGRRGHRGETQTDTDSGSPRLIRDAQSSQVEG